MEEIHVFFFFFFFVFVFTDFSLGLQAAALYVFDDILLGTLAGLFQGPSCLPCENYGERLSTYIYISIYKWRDNH